MDIACSDILALAGVLRCQSQSAGTYTLATWVDIKKWRKLMFIIDCGTVGSSATVDAVVKQATTSSGTGSKNLTTSKAITELTAAGTCIINVRGSDLDMNNGFEFVNLSVTIGTAACVVSIYAIGDPVLTPPTIASGASVASQIIA